jgi:hypothetical protein
MSRNHLARRVAAVLSIGGLLAVAAACAPPAPTYFSLSGEHLVATPPATITSGTCNPAGVSTFAVTSTGTASGPYPGTYVETITATLGPQTEEFQPGQFRGDVTALQSTVDITSPAGNVHLTHTLDTGQFAKGVCQTSSLASWTIAGQLAVNTNYQGTMGDAVASGTSNLQFNMYDADCGCSGGDQFHHDFS